MINISSIKKYMFCPMSLYIKTYVEDSEPKDFIAHKELKNLRIDIQNLLEKNMRNLKEIMDLDEIERILTTNIPKYIENTRELLKNDDINPEIVKEIEVESYYLLKLLSLRAKKAMRLLNCDGHDIIDMFYPNSMYNYFIKDAQLDLVGVCDKIEIIDGKYYPIAIKSSKPPLKGVWDQDAIELVATAILIEQEFDTEVFVGFIEYTKIGDRRPVVMDVNLRKALFDIINETKEILINKKIPTVRIKENKCRKCEHRHICLKED